MDRRQLLMRGAVTLTAPFSFVREARAAATAIGAASVRFATPAQGRAVLGAADDWVAATSEFHRAATLGTNAPVSRETLRAFCADAVLAWPSSAQARWSRALATLAPRVGELRLPLPAEVLLIRSTGRDSANAPYTRQNAVVLPAEGVPDDASTDAFVLAHEMFHVASRHAPALADRLYALLGFEPVAPLQWPVEWQPMRIANPDAPHDRHMMRTTIGGRGVALMPLLMARRSELKPGETFFDVLDVRLLEVSVGDTTLPVRRDGQPVWHAPADAPDYLARLGGNTDYIFHPEETMADNFALLACGREVPNRGLLGRIERALRANAR